MSRVGLCIAPVIVPQYKCVTATTRSPVHAVKPNEAPGSSSRREMLRTSIFRRGAAAAGSAAFAAAAGSAAYYQPRLEAAPAAGLDPKSWVPLKLVSTTPVSANTAIYRFAFEDKEATSGMKVASCLVVKAAIGKEKEDGTRGNVLRPYTPLSRPEAKGYLDLAVKVYPTGKMSQHFASLKPGDTLDFKGPILKIDYKPNQYKEIGMVAGGTGITPMLQVVDEVLANPADKTKVSLVFGNVTEADILLKDEIDARAKAHPDKFSVYYVVDKASSAGWKGGVGYVTKDMLIDKMPPPSDESIVFVCGPPPMYKAICGPKGTPEDPKAQGEVGGILSDLGYTSRSVFKF